MPKSRLYHYEEWLKDGGLLDVLALSESCHDILFSWGGGECLWSCAGLDDGKWTFAGIPLGDDVFSEAVYRAIAADVAQNCRAQLYFITKVCGSELYVLANDCLNNLAGMLLNGDRDYGTEHSAPSDLRDAIEFVTRHAIRKENADAE